MNWAFRKRGAPKYANKKTEHAGFWFDSQLEKGLFSLLSLRERGGEIRDLSHHPGTVYLSQARIQYRPDFRFTVCETGETQYAEAKGFETSDWRIKRKLWLSYGPANLEIWMGKARSLFLKEVLIPKGGDDGADTGTDGHL